MTDTSFDPDPNLDAIAAEQGKTALIAELQQALFTGPGALYGLQGAEAIGRASDIAAGLQDRRDDILGRIADPAERSALARQLDTVLAGANQGIGRHLAAQHAALDRSARGERFGVLRTEARLDPHDDDRIDALARAAAGTALDGAAASAAWSSVHADAIDSRLDLGNPAGALTLWDRTRDSLDDRTRAALEPTIQSTRTRLAADELAKSSFESFGDVELSSDDVPPGGDEVEGGSADDTPSLASPMERAKTEIENRDDQPPEVRRLAIAQLDEQADAERARRSSETSDIADKADRLATLAATAPHRYNRGSFQALAGRAAAIGDTSSALKYGHLAANEDYITAFARLSPTAQQRQLADLPPEPTRDFLEEVQRRQRDAFIKDAFTTGIGLYPELGPPAGTLEGRVAQARTIAERSGQPTLPLSQAEIAAARQKLDASDPDEQMKRLAPFATLPAETVPGMVRAYAGGEAGDARSRSYAAAGALLAADEPQQTAVAGQILRGAQIRKDAGAAPWQAELLEELKTRSLDATRMPAEVAADAIAAVYA